jgi:hypothetical protein
MQIRVANATKFNADSDLSLTGRGDRHVIDHLQGLSVLM